eukprot:6774802-Pyramimonas_sp.AAC.1
MKKNKYRSSKSKGDHNIASMLEGLNDDADDSEGDLTPEGKMKDFLQHISPNARPVSEPDKMLSKECREFMKMLKTMKTHPLAAQASPQPASARAASAIGRPRAPGEEAALPEVAPVAETTSEIIPIMKEFAQKPVPDLSTDDFQRLAESPGLTQAVLNQVLAAT